MAKSGALDALIDFAGAMLPLRARNLQTVIDENLSQIPNELNEYGYDAYGMSPFWMRRVLMPFALLYRYYFRVEVAGIENLPEGRVIVIANHAGQLPFDAAMLGLALLMEAKPPRIARGMGEYWIPQLPWVSVIAARTGTLVGTPQNCIHMLENGECVLAFPEGVRGMNKLFSQRYQLQRFGTGFMRLALETDTPIVPVAIVGSEEQHPSFANLEGVARMFGAPALPITPTFPWLGPLGLLPLPVKYHIYFGEPLRFDGEASDEDANIDAKVDEVKAKIAGLLARGRREREGIFS
ncbi:MAG: acyltransferase family protein [Deltaproteobacteria bacterium]|nr:acyltransferase family protein [Deltaproteobacteria bacterium]MBW2694617.1 acyltransferase family protein [Deltaproteobacteria bacterium]